jgi:hypothetical protein
MLTGKPVSRSYSDNNNRCDMGSNDSCGCKYRELAAKPPAPANYEKPGLLLQPGGNLAAGLRVFKKNPTFAIPIITNMKF